MSSSNKIDGILVDSKELEDEKCGTCKKHLFLKTYLNLTSKKRILTVSCKTCGYETQIRSLQESEKFKIKPSQPRRGWRY